MVISVAAALNAYKQSGGASAESEVASTTPVEGVGSFADTLKGFVGDTVGAVKKAEEMSAAGAVGKANLQDVILAVNNAEVMMQTMVALRDRVTNAYEEVIRMPI